MTFLRNAWSFVKANLLLTLFLIFVGGLLVAPFMFWGFNKLRGMAPEAVRNIIPAAKPVDAEAIVEKVTPAAT